MGKYESFFPTTDPNDFRILFGNPADPRRTSAGDRVIERYHDPLSKVVTRTLRGHWRGLLEAEAVAEAWSRFLTRVRERIMAASPLPSGSVRELAEKAAKNAVWLLQQQVRRGRRRSAPVEAARLVGVPAAVAAIDARRILESAWRILLANAGAEDRQILERIGLAGLLAAFDGPTPPIDVPRDRWLRIRRSYRKIAKELLNCASPRVALDDNE